LKTALVVVLAAGIALGAFAQTKTIRIVTYNIETDTGTTTPLPGLIAPSGGGNVSQGGVLEGIGEEIVAGDPAQPLDILALQETTSNPTTVAPIVSALNTFYNAPGMYAMSPFQATESGNSPTVGNGPNALVYNTTTLQLVASVPVDPVGGTGKLGSKSGEYREVMRYEFAPAGLIPAPSNEFYIYVSHYKASTGSTNAFYRSEEAAIIRTNETSLPTNARVLYVGDYNVDTSGEAGYQTILAATSPNGVAQGQGIDPLNPSASTTIDWSVRTTDKTILPMLSEKSTALDYRDDLQVMTANVYNAAPGGLCYVPGSLHSFGNNGTAAYGSAVTAGANTALSTNLGPNPFITASALRQDLTTASDHLPVVADYTIPVNLPPLRAGRLTMPAPGVFQFALSNSDGTSITTAQLPFVQVQSSPDLAHWSAVTNIALINGALQIADTNPPASQKFYRAIEVP